MPKMSKRMNAAVYVGTVLFSILFLTVGHMAATKDLALFSGDGMGAVRARVDEILSVYEGEADPFAQVPEETLRVAFRATLQSGPQEGARVTGVQTADSFTPTDIRRVAPGDEVLLYEIEEAPPESEERWVLQEFVRTRALVWLGAFFVAALLFFGRRKGFHTVISLGLTCLAIFAVFVPSVLSGFNMYVTIPVICLYIIVMTLLLINGPNAKSLAAGAGCFGGICASGLLVLVSDGFLKLTGLVDEQSVYLLYLNPDAPIDLHGVIFSSIIIGALGATLDVSVSIASALAELRDVMRRPTFSALFRSGMNIGQDIMGTMANTLVLAYIGSSLSLVLLLLVHSTSLTDMLNREIIVVETLQTLVGSIGLLCTIPLTSALAAWVYTRGARGPGGTS